ncbi:MAG: CBS domain-containing protein [Cellvibrio sp.]|nr:CBS domain-containing protein [Cellvibrio sp.]
MSDVFKFNNANESNKSDALRNHYREMSGQEINEEVLRSWLKDADKNCTVHQIMNKEVISVDQGETVERVAKKLLDRHIHRVFVTDANKVVGVITTMDVLGALVN